jgi:hypothetical protein
MYSVSLFTSQDGTRADLRSWINNPREEEKREAGKARRFTYLRGHHWPVWLVHQAEIAFSAADAAAGWRLSGRSKLAVSRAISLIAH